MGEVAKVLADYDVDLTEADIADMLRAAFRTQGAIRRRPCTKDDGDDARQSVEAARAADQVLAAWDVETRLRAALQRRGNPMTVEEFIDVLREVRQSARQ